MPVNRAAQRGCHEGGMQSKGTKQEGQVSQATDRKGFLYFTILLYVFRFSACVVCAWEGSIFMPWHVCGGRSLLPPSGFQGSGLVTNTFTCRVISLGNGIDFKHCELSYEVPRFSQILFLIFSSSEASIIHRCSRKLGVMMRINVLKF